MLYADVLPLVDAVSYLALGLLCVYTVTGFHPGTAHDTVICRNCQIARREAHGMLREVMDRTGGCVKAN